MDKPNVLFIAVDDLRTALGCYGDSNAITPNIDRLAGGGMLFQRAYCQQAVCNPSRASLMTGLRPDTLKVWDLKSHFRHELPARLADLPQHCGGTHFRAARPDVVTLPEYFKQHGYIARSVGKIYHGSPQAQDAQSWSADALLNVVWKSDDYLLPENQAPQVESWPGYKMRPPKLPMRPTTPMAMERSPTPLASSSLNLALIPSFWLSASASRTCPSARPSATGIAMTRVKSPRRNTRRSQSAFPTSLGITAGSCAATAMFQTPAPFPTIWRASSGMVITPASAIWTPKWASCWTPWMSRDCVTTPSSFSGATTVITWARRRFGAKQATTNWIRARR
ncbi:MAG: sulfatase-like hydrolase/transferase [Anaerolineae bacterium]|nr:sulfatase-like hydrolase/transferase [Anaerolineae bacterium]